MTPDYFLGLQILHMMFNYWFWKMFVGQKKEKLIKIGSKNHCINSQNTNVKHNRFNHIDLEIFLWKLDLGHFCIWGCICNLRKQIRCPHFQDKIFFVPLKSCGIFSGVLTESKEKGNPGTNLPWENPGEYSGGNRPKHRTASITWFCLFFSSSYLCRNFLLLLLLKNALGFACHFRWV